MSDFIEISDLLVRTIIGINPEERTNKQDVLINLRLATDTRPAAQTDDISHALNYRTVTKNVIEFTEASQFNLVETLAQAIAELCLQEPLVQAVTVKVQKPGAIRFARSVGVTIHRARQP